MILARLIPRWLGNPPEDKVVTSNLVPVKDTYPLDFYAAGDWYRSIVKEPKDIERILANNTTMGYRFNPRPEFSQKLEDYLP